MTYGFQSGGRESRPRYFDAVELSIRDDLLFVDGARVPYRETPNRSGEISPRFLVMHYTAGASFESSVAWLRNPLALASAHLVIARDGRIAQLAPFRVKTWHAGPSFWRGVTGLNAHSIGIELDNAGVLTRHGDAWRSAFGTGIPAADAVELRHKQQPQAAGWQIYPAAQLETAALVAAALCRAYSLVDVAGHDDIAPGRKLDPGPAFPMSSFRARVLGRASDDLADLRTTAVLRIRRGPGTEYPEQPGSPLAAGAALRLLDEDGVWYRVDVLDERDLTGWVHSRFVTPA